MSARQIRSYRIPVYKVQLVRDGSRKATQKKVCSPCVAADVLREFLAGTDREHLVVLMLNSHNQIVGIHTVSVGTIDSTLVSAANVFKPAILANAASIIVGHNHPSGDPSPSMEDLQIHDRLARAGKDLDIEVLDFVVVGDAPHRWWSAKR